MALRDISDRAAVLQAIAEYDAIGEEAFLEKYGFDLSRVFWLEHDGRRYASKAILGAAHAYQFPEAGPLTATDFTGGERTVRKLRSLGFTVLDEQQPSNPDWDTDEIVLAMNLYLTHVREHGRPPGKESPEVNALSELLRRYHSLLGTPPTQTLRNPAGVYMKLMNLRALDPEVIARNRKGLSAGSCLEREVWQEFFSDQQRLARVAAAITARINASDATEPLGDLPEDDEAAPEGRLLTREHRARERNRTLVAKKKAQVMRQSGRLACEACGFDFNEAYGERGHGFIECHHTRPVETLAEGSVTRLSDLAVLCANCHRMIHVRRPWLSVEELRDLAQHGYARGRP